MKEEDFQEKIRAKEKQREKLVNAKTKQIELEADKRKNDEEKMMKKTLLAHSLVTALAIAPAAHADEAALIRRIDQLAAAGADVALGSFKITGLANGAAAGDAVNLAQRNVAVPALR